MSFVKLDQRDIRENTWRLICDDWMLVTAGAMDSWNTMTASWGGFGHLWNRDVAFAFVRPCRHTFGFMERNELFTLSFFDPDMKEALSVCGSVSGRDTDKAAKAGITPVEATAPGAAFPGAVSFAEARLALVCRKLHAQDIDPARFATPEIEGFYPEKDYHRLYIGAIEAALGRA